jgi:hypothetical protein
MKFKFILGTNQIVLKKNQHWGNELKAYAMYISFHNYTSPIRDANSYVFSIDHLCKCNEMLC